MWPYYLQLVISHVLELFQWPRFLNRYLFRQGILTCFQLCGLAASLRDCTYLHSCVLSCRCSRCIVCIVLRSWNTVKARQWGFSLVTAEISAEASAEMLLHFHRCFHLKVIRLARINQNYHNRSYTGGTVCMFLVAYAVLHQKNPFNWIPVHSNETCHPCLMISWKDCTRIYLSLDL